MYNGLSITKGLSFMKIIGGLSKTLQVANQIIPLYQKAKPVIINAKNMLGVLKEFNKSSESTNNNINKSSNNNINLTEKNLANSKEKMSASPTFFL